MDEVSYRQMEPGEEKSVCALVRLVFSALVAPDYEQAGIEEFFRFANPETCTADSSSNSSSMPNGSGRPPIRIAPP